MKRTIRFSSRDGMLEAIYTKTEKDSTVEVLFNEDNILKWSALPVTEEMFHDRFTKLVAEYDTVMCKLSQPISDWNKE